MTSEKYIELLEQEGVLPDRLIAKLRAKLDETGGKMPAKTLAKFLVQKKHLSHHKAAELLHAPLDDAPPEESDPEGSKVLAGIDTDTRMPGDAAPTHNGSAAEEVPLTPVEDLQDLSARKQSAEPHAELMHDPLLAEVSLRGKSGILKPNSSGVLRRRVKEAKGRAHPPIADRSEERKRRRKKPVSKKKKNEWDSPLLLMGGGGLILLILCGATVWYMLFRDSGDEQLQLARSAMADGSYSQAISQYERFVEDFPSHPEQSTARVELAMARLRRVTEGRSDHQLALEVAQTEIDAVEDEEKFNDAHEELATLLPTIARGLAEQADAAAEPAQVGGLIEQATMALALCGNSKYIPRSLRDETELQEVRAILDRVRRGQKSYDDLQATLKKMDQAIDAGDTRTAYEAHRNLLKEHPQLAGEPALEERVANTSAAEQSGVSFVRNEKQALTEDGPSPLVAALAVANHRGGGTATAEGAVCVHIDGAIYGLEAASGRLVWRRFTGFDPQPFMAPVEGDVLVRDALRGELLRLSRQTGDLRWRLPLDEPFAKPLLHGGRAYLAAQSGRLYVVDLTSGNCAGYVQFAQALRVPPAIGPRGRWIYLVGEHSSVYSIALNDLSCTDVHYLGHSAGSVHVAPAAILNKLAVFENYGVKSSLLHVLALDEEGTIGNTVTEDRLSGLVVTPPLISGRRLVVITDRGQMNVYEVGPQSDRSALTTVATREASNAGSLACHALMADNFIWTADSQLTKLAVQPTGNRLPVRDIEQNYAGSTFDHPIQAVGDALVHVRRPADRRGAAVAAMKVSSGQALWEIDLAVPPAGAPILAPTGNGFVVGSANGHVLPFDAAAIRSGLQDRPVPAEARPRQPPLLNHATDLGEGRAVFSSDRSRWLLLYSPQGSSRWVQLPSPVVAPPVQFAGGLLAPLEIGQVFLLNPEHGEPLAAPFQPPLQPRSQIPWLPVGTASHLPNQCVLGDGRDRLYLLGLNERPQLVAQSQAEVESIPLASRIVILDDKAVAATSDGRLAAFQLPSLELINDAQLSGNTVWGPYRVADCMLLATDDDYLQCVTAAGDIRWKLPLTGRELAGAPLASRESVLVAYRDGTLQKLDLANGKETGNVDVGQPLDAGPVRFQNRLILAAHDGTILVVDQP